MSKPVLLRAEGHISRTHFSALHTHTDIKILSKAPTSSSRIMYSYSFYDIYLFWYFHSNYSQEIASNLEGFYIVSYYAKGEKQW